ncbi:MAG: hypothetical protein AB7F35_23380 [Acetobacteraceae bacterium]
MTLFTAACLVGCTSQTPALGLIASATDRIEYAVVEPTPEMAAELIHAKLSGVEVMVVADHESATLMPMRAAGAYVFLANVPQEFLRVDGRAVMADGEISVDPGTARRYGVAFRELLLSARRAGTGRPRQHAGE